MIRPFIVVPMVLFIAAACAAQVQSDGPEEKAQPPAVAEPERQQQAAEAAAAPTDSEVMYRVFAAELLGNEGDLQGAVGEYLEAAMESDDPAIAMRATRVAFAAQAWQQASMAADRWAYLDPENIAARESAALSMLATADYAAAELQLQRLLELSADKEQAWSAISSLLGRSASPEKAMKVLSNLLEAAGEQSSSAAGLHAQSQLAVRLGDLARAYSLAQQAVAIQPERVEFLAWAGRLALNQGNMAEGLDYFRQAWEQQPDDHDLTLAYADLLARDGQEQAARDLLVNMQQSPDVMLTRILFELGAKKIDAAMALYEQFKTMTFDDAQLQAFYLAQSAEAVDRTAEAITFYGQVEDHDLAIEAAVRRAELTAAMGDMTGARNILATLRVHSDQAVVEESWLTEARILQQRGLNDQAFEVLSAALQQLGQSIPIRYSHALLAAEAGQTEVAEQDLRFILSEQPENVAALNALGYTLADQTERYDEAEDLIRQAFALQPNDASITDSMGWVAYRQGRLAEAVAYLRKAWELDHNAEIAAHLGEVLWQQGEHDAARQAWAEGMQADPENRTLLETMQRLDSAD